MIFEDDPKARVFELFALLTVRPRKRLDRSLKLAAGLTYPQFGALYAIGAKVGMSQKRLADSLETDTTNAMVICDSLEKKRLIAREAVPRDRRSNSLAITDAGRLALARAMPVVESVYGPLLRAITEEDMGRILPILEKLRGALLARDAE